MLRKFVYRLLHDQRGNNLIAYALVLGGIAIAGATYLSRVSGNLKAGLGHQADKIAVTAGTYQAPAAATPPSNPTQRPRPPRRPPEAAEAAGKKARRANSSARHRRSSCRFEYRGSYRMASEGLLPDPRLATWVEESVAALNNGK